MSAMLLSPVMLRTIADKLEVLSKIGIDVREFVVGDIVVYITCRDDQREGSSYYVTCLKTASKVNPKPVLRAVHSE